MFLPYPIINKTVNTNRASEVPGLCGQFFSFFGLVVSFFTFFSRDLELERFLMKILSNK